MKSYSVTVPVAGHACIEVEAESEEAAISKALEEITLDNLESWEAIKRFHTGNICHCPHPWAAQADAGDDE